MLPLLLSACTDRVGGSAVRAGSDGTPELQQAVLANDHDRVVELLGNGADPDQIGPDGSAAVHLAAFSDNPAHLISLLEAGADPDVPHAITGASALDRSLLNRNEEVFHLLLQAGANPGVVDLNGGTPLHTAARTNKGWALLALLEAGADPLAELTRGATFQHFYWGYNPALLNDRARAERAALIDWLEANDIPVDPRAEEFRSGR